MQAIKERLQIEDAVLETLRYFHIFRHPLYLEEIHRYLSIDIKIVSLSVTIKEMLDAGLLFQHHDLYMLEDDETLAQKRVTGAEKASKAIDRAKRSISIISKFPFVKGVCISGSLSKGYADERSDADFFIITSRQRLWICRSLLHMFKKFTYLLNRQHAFCMNYFIDESRLNIEEQNIYTATELATLIPVYNTESYKELINRNKYWLVNLFPNIKWEHNADYAYLSPKAVKSVMESFINLLFPKYLNNWLMKFTDSWWRFKWQQKNYPMHEYDLAMKTRWYVSKNHPKNYQKKVLQQLDESFIEPVLQVRA
jgi:hypothetical protein